MQTYVSDELTYLKSQTDLIYLTAYNNDAATLNTGDVVVIDYTYTSGLAVKTTTTSNDQRVFGVVASASISSHASGIIAIGGTVQNINVTGPVYFGHALITSTTAHYAADSFSGGWGPGVVGFALASNAVGNATIAALIKPYPQFYGIATSILTVQTNNAPTINNVINNAQSFGTNRVMLLFIDPNGTNACSAAKFNTSEAFATLENSGSATKVYFSALAPSNNTANIIQSGINQAAAAAVLLLNYVNTTTPLGTPVDASSTGTSVSITIGCAVGDLVIAGFGTQTNVTVSARGSGQGNIANIPSAVAGLLCIDAAIANSTSITFTWTISSSVAWDAVGVAVKTM